MPQFSTISRLTFLRNPDSRPYGPLLWLCALFVFVTVEGLPARAQSNNTCELFPLDAPTPSAGNSYAQHSSIGEHFAIVSANANITGTVPGQAHIYEYTGGVWVFRQTLNAPGTLIADGYGNSVYIDDNTALVAAYNYIRPGIPASGSDIIYVYTRQGSQ